jgi:hypothetical protein
VLEETAVSSAFSGAQKKHVTLITVGGGGRKLPSSENFTKFAQLVIFNTAARKVQS